MGELTPNEIEVLRRLASLQTDPVCPNCAQRYVDPLSDNGWCVRCDARRERALESKRRWWERTRGAGSKEPQP